MRRASGESSVAGAQYACEERAAEQLGVIARELVPAARAPAALEPLVDQEQVRPA